MRFCLTIVKRLSKDFSHIEISALHAYFSRMAYRRANPVVFRLPKPQTRALQAIASAHGLTANVFMKRLAIEQLVTANSVPTEQDVMPPIPQRSIAAPENRVKIERPASGSGFADRLK
jgi:hypothetical protein